MLGRVNFYNLCVKVDDTIDRDLIAYEQERAYCYILSVINAEQMPVLQQQSRP